MQPHASPRLQHKLTCNSHHMQLTYTANTDTLTHHATLTCSHMQLSPATHTFLNTSCNTMHLTHKHALRINLAWPAAGLHIGLHALIISRACMCSSDARRMQRYPGNASTHAPDLHRACIVFASYLHRVCMGLHAHASPMQVR